MNYVIYVFPLLLMVSGNYLDHLLSCDAQRLVRDNLWLRHLFAFLTLVLFVHVIRKSDNDDAGAGAGDNERVKTSRGWWLTLRHVGEMVIVYALFLMLCRAEIHVALLVLVLAGVLYGIGAHEEATVNAPPVNAPVTPSWHARAKSILSTVLVALLVVGVLANAGRQSAKRARWSWSTFLLGTKKHCNFDRRVAIGDLSTVWADVARGGRRVLCLEKTAR